MFPLMKALRLAAIQPVQSQVHSAEPHIRVDPMAAKAGAAGALGGSDATPASMFRRFASHHTDALYASLMQ